MNTYLDRPRLKRKAKDVLRRNRKIVLLASLLSLFLTAPTLSTVVDSSGSETIGFAIGWAGINWIQSNNVILLGQISMISLILSVLLFNVLDYGRKVFYLEAFQERFNLKNFFVGFQDYTRVISTYVMQYLLIALWTLLLIIPGIMKVYSYAMVPYVLKTHPELSTMEVLRESERLMKGHRFDYFIYQLSFIGWSILIMVVTLVLPYSFGIIGVLIALPYSYVASLIVNAYIELANAAYYLNLEAMDRYEEVVVQL